MNILLIEDDPDAAQILEKNLSQWGHEVEQAATCAEALKKVRLFNFDLILLDLFLPDGQGQDLIPHFKQWAPDAVIVTMTGRNTRDLEQEVRRMGVLFYMIKPFETKHLQSMVRHIAGNKGFEVHAELMT
ncbi:MAG: response regulator [Desulfobacteraceae bacterium]|nr:MAG: response regulator [Desulfobacteraceae bacterium]